MTKQKKIRLDLLLVERGLAVDVAEAAALLLAGRARVKGCENTKPGTTVATDVVVEVEPASLYVSRGGLKLAAAIDHFRLDVAGCVAVDVGASTGGFTDCLLQRGAAKVFALDVGRGLLHQKLRADPRVVVVERCNARSFGSREVPVLVDIATIDVSFISLKLVLPAVVRVMASGAWMVALVKPQFEAAREEVELGGVVRDETVRRRVVDEVAETMRTLGLSVIGACDSPIAGPKGNRERLVGSRRTAFTPGPSHGTNSARGDRG